MVLICGKLCWPTKLTFIYPRWQIDPGAWWQYLFPLAADGIAGGALVDPAADAAPLAALLFFGGTLFPVLGFFNLYTFRYSLVANHYQYLASLGAITLAAAGVVWLLERWRLWRRPAGYVVCLALLATLAGLTWRQSRMYADHETLYRTTIDGESRLLDGPQQPRAALARRGQVDDAIAQFQKVLEIKPDDAEGHNNLGLALAGRGQVDEAIAHYQKALEIKPAYAKAENNLGVVLAGQGKLVEAITHFRKALKSTLTMPRPTITLVMLWRTGAKRLRRWPITGRPWTLPRNRTTKLWLMPCGLGSPGTRPESPFVSAAGSRPPPAETIA